MGGHLDIIWILQVNQAYRGIQSDLEPEAEVTNDQA